MNRRAFFQTAGSALTAAMPARSAAGKPNILLITTDQQSEEAMSCRTGTRWLRTPAMDSLAATGTVFTRAYAPNPICVPCRTSMYTGHYPLETGVQHNAQIKNTQKFPIMGKVFRDAGYEAAYTGKWHIAYPESDEAGHGFHILQEKVADRDTNATEAAAKFLRRKQAKPFLLVASLLNPHNICEWPRGQELPCGPIGAPPPPAQCPPRRANWSPQRDEPDMMTVMRRSYHATPTFPVGKMDENQWRIYIWAYYRMIEKVDALIGKVLGALRESGQEENTLVVFLSDHGDMQGAHGWNQKTVFYEESARVPLIVSLKGATRQGTSPRLVNTGVDLLPTLCDYAGIAAPSGLPGRSVRDSRPREYVVASHHMMQGMPGDPTPTGRMVATARYKYCVHSEGARRESLVDLQKDPGEMVNLAAGAGHAKVLNQHRAMLAEWGSKHGDDFPALPPAS